MSDRCVQLLYSEYGTLPCGEPIEDDSEFCPYHAAPSLWDDVDSAYDSLVEPGLSD